MTSRPTAQPSRLLRVSCACVIVTIVGCVARRDTSARTPDGSAPAAGNDAVPVTPEAGAEASAPDAATAQCSRESYTMDRDCDAPPVGECIDDRTWGAYESLGRCVAMRCEYTPRPRPCFGGCSSQGCTLCPGGEVVDPVSVFRDGALGWPARTCWPLDALRDPTHLPHLMVDPDAGAPELPNGCPDADALEWGSIAGEDCVDLPACPALLDATETECCYAAYRACGV